MRNKILKRLGIVLLIIGIIGFIIYNMTSQFSKLQQGKLLSEILTDTIPFTYSSSGHILIKVKINGNKKASSFILDSGASNFIFSTRVDELKLDMNGRGIGINSNSNVFFTKIRSIDTLQIGTSKFVNTNANEIEFNYTCSDDIYGIIGIGVMRHLIWQIDFEKKEIIVAQKLEALSFHKEKIEICLSENKMSHHLRTKIRLNDQKKTITVLIDLGSNGSLKLKEAYVLGDSLILRSKKINGNLSKGLGGGNSKAKEKIYLADSLFFANSSYRIKNIPISSREKSLNLLGLEFFNKYKTTLSWKDKKLILEPYANAQNFIWDSYGFSIDYDRSLNKVIIKTVTENTPASRAELIVNSEIISINNETVIDESSFCNYMKLIQSNDTIRLKVSVNDVINSYVLVKEALFCSED